MPALVPALADTCVVINGVAKTYAMTGWRVGWMIGPNDVIKAAANLQSHATSNVCNVAQRAALTAVSGDLSAVAEMRATYDRRRLTITKMLNGIPGIRCPEPEGAFYAFPNATKITHDDRALAKFLLEEGGVACGGGSSFGAAGKGYLRFSYAASLEDIDWALEQIAKVLPTFKG